jgi:hypothetical protein
VLPQVRHPQDTSRNLFETGNCSSEDIFIADWGDYDLSTIPITVIIGGLPSEEVKTEL